MDSMVFSEPIQEGAYKVITVSKHQIRKDRHNARPVAVIILKPEGVQIKPMNPPPQTLIWVALMTIVSMGTILVILFPPWKPDTSLLREVKELIKTIRGRTDKAEAG